MTSLLLGPGLWFPLFPTGSASPKPSASLLPGFGDCGDWGAGKELAKVERERGAWVGSWTLERQAEGRPWGTPRGGSGKGHGRGIRAHQL